MKSRVPDLFETCMSPIVMAAVLVCFSCTTMAQGFKSITQLESLPVVKNTAEKPQSKVWNYDGKWWAVFSINEGTFVGRLDGTTWKNVLKISSSTSVEADCKLLEDICHIFLWRKENNVSQFVSVEYDHLSETYVLWSKRPSTVLISLDSGAETGTIDIDGSGRMWLASDGISDIRVRWSDPPYDRWSDPVIVASGITNDDICAVIALPVQGQTGILWSDQNSKKFGFKTHNDGTSPSIWSNDEVPASQSALNVGKGMGDDHLNVAISSDGTLYCAVKTSYDTPGYPRLALLRRRPEGRWDDLYEVSESGTRGIVLLNEAAAKLKVVYTSEEDGGDILYRESSMSNISFSPPLTLIEGVYNNPTSSKNNYDDDIVILASDNTHLVGVLGTDYPALTVGVAPFPEIPAPYAATMYPNPVDDIISMDFREEAGAGFSVLICDILGNIYFNTTEIRSQKTELNITDLHLSSGLYLLMIRSDKHSQVIRFVKK